LNVFQIRAAAALLLILLSGCQAQAPSNAPDPALRGSDPVEQVIAELQLFIPERMQQDGIPGLSLALVWDGQLAWVEGFGKLDRFGGAPVTADTIFEAASNGKVISAYMALQMVDEGLLDLDAPLDSYLEQSWLPDSSNPSEITLLHVLTHSSGLSNDANGWDRSVNFEPGEQYAYSGAGWRYLQEVIAETDPEDALAAAERRVFVPLGMQDASFQRPAATDLERLSSGHLEAFMPTLLYQALFNVLFGGLTFAIWLWDRWRKTAVLGSARSWALAWILGQGAAIAIIVVVFNRGFTRLILLAGLPATAAAAILSLIVFRQLGPRLKKVPGRLAVYGAVTLLTLGLSNSIQVPVNRGGIRTNYAFSLHASARDMGLFMAELANPTLISGPLWQEMITPRIRVNDHISWGLGIGIQHSQTGDSLWQWGANPGYQSLMVVYPDEGIGIVILTNSSDGLQAARDIAQQALGGKAYWNLDP
jgi:CubicO group peptidase (beta-lactamase class C family)